MHRYTITLEDTAAEHPRTTTFEVSSHDDLFRIIELARSTNLVADEEVEAFALGVKLFGGALLAHRREGLFAEIAGPFGSFMRQLKAAVPPELKARYRGERGRAGRGGRPALS